MKMRTDFKKSRRSEERTATFIVWTSSIANNHYDKEGKQDNCSRDHFNAEMKLSFSETSMRKRRRGNLLRTSE